MRDPERYGYVGECTSMGSEFRASCFEARKHRASSALSGHSGTADSERTMKSSPGTVSTTTPPHPDEAFRIDIAPFARQASLQQNAGATVMLRVEVHGSGAIGRVEVNVSGGSRRDDRAANAYVRALKWIGGRR